MQTLRLLIDRLVVRFHPRPPLQSRLVRLQRRAKNMALKLLRKSVSDNFSIFPCGS